MDTQQIQQQMRARRVAIDAKLDLLNQATATARRRGVTTFVALASAVTVIVIWARRRAARKALRMQRSRLLKAG